MATLIKGIANMPVPEAGSKWVYGYPLRIHTKWPHSRCQFGCVSFFYQLQPGIWLAVTNKSIVQENGTPGGGMPNPDSPSPVGVDVWMHEFTNPTLGADVSFDPSVFRDKGKFGKVVAEVGPTMVAIEVERSVIADEGFKNNGHWMKLMGSDKVQ
jgi:hypothetical protein